MKHFPSLETMLGATEPLQTYDPLRPAVDDAGCTDHKEFVMWRARHIDSRRVQGTIEGVMDCPNLILFSVAKGRMS